MYELAVVGLSTAAAVVVLRLVRTQIYIEPWTTDPWLHTALMTHFDFIYHHFVTTYYASRLPSDTARILPQLVPHTPAGVRRSSLRFLPRRALPLHLLVRTLFGVRFAVLVYPAVLMNATCVNAHTWDYMDGFVITYLSGGLYFVASCTGRTSRGRPGAGRGHFRSG